MTARERAAYIRGLGAARRIAATARAAWRRNRNRKDLPDFLKDMYHGTCIGCKGVCKDIDERIARAKRAAKKGRKKK